MRRSRNTSVAAAVALSLVPTSGRSLDVKLTIRGGATATATTTRLTHFLSLRLGDPRLHARVAAVQQAIIAREKRARGCDVPPEKSHLTGFVLALPDEEAVAAAVDALAACSSLVTPGSRAPRLHFSGLGSFRSNVVFAKPLPTEDHDGVVHLVAGARHIFEERGLLARTSEAWTPHLTLLKTSRVPPRKGRPPAKLPAACWSELPDDLSLDFGVHPLPRLELCAMQGVGPDGFYKVVSAIPLGSGNVELT